MSSALTDRRSVAQESSTMGTLTDQLKVSEELLIPQSAVSYISYWYGPIPAVTALFFRSFLNTQPRDARLAVYVENCPNSEVLDQFVRTGRVLVVRCQLDQLCSTCGFAELAETLAPHRGGGLWGHSARLVQQSYRRLCCVKSDLDREERNYHFHRTTGFTPKVCGEIASWHRNTVGASLAPTLRGDVFRVVMAAGRREPTLYVDLDICFLKDFSPLFGQEDFVYEWENEPYANSAVMYSAAAGCLKTEGSRWLKSVGTPLPWIYFAYDTDFMRNMRVYPSELFDVLWKGRLLFAGRVLGLDDFFEAGPHANWLAAYLQENCYAYHWHNRWGKKWEVGSPYSILLGEG